MDISSISSSPAARPGMGDRSAAVAAEASPTVKPTATPVDTAAAVEQPKSIPNMDQVNQAIKGINKTMEGLSQGLEFTVDSDTHQTVVKVIDKQTKAVIRQMPTEEALQIAKALDHVQGLLIRQKA